jgi:chorismate mutase
MIYIKNPVNPDLALWIGGVERFMNHNIKNLGVIHRGFSNYDKTQFRNQPEWQIAIDFRNQFPLLPIIADPSHIAGNRIGLQAIAQKAMHLGYNGLMIETHDRPDEAWSDAQQQITPHSLKLLIDSLEYRFLELLQPDFQLQLGNFRSQIDELDLKIVDLLGKRMAIATEIGRIKKANQVTILQNKRWIELLQTMTEQGRKKGLSEHFMLNLFKAIHQESISHQENV